MQTVDQAPLQHFTFNVPTSVDDCTSSWKSGLANAQDALSSLEHLNPSVVAKVGHLSALKPLDEVLILLGDNTNIGRFFRTVYPSRELRDEAERAERAFKKLRNDLDL